jgi:hypothetical protein
MPHLEEAPAPLGMKIIPSCLHGIVDATIKLQTTEWVID